jgi:hypothetical protein
MAGRNNRAEAAVAAGATGVVSSEKRVELARIVK